MGLATAFGWSPETWTAIGTLALAGATVLALAVTPFWRWLDRARLTLEIRKAPPDSHMITMTNLASGAVIGDTLYVRARVAHRRGRAAENAEVLAARLWRITDDGKREPVSTFLPLSLNWSHVGGPTIRVPRKLFRLCDVGHFMQVGQETMFILDTIVQPNPVAGREVPNVLRAGRYELELRLSGDNTKTLGRTWTIKFDGSWHADQQSMLDSVSIERARGRLRRLLPGGRRVA